MTFARAALSSGDLMLLENLGDRPLMDLLELQSKLREELERSGNETSDGLFLGEGEGE